MRRVVHKKVGRGGRVFFDGYTTYLSRLHIARYSPSLIRDSSISRSMISRRRNFVWVCGSVVRGAGGDMIVGVWGVNRRIYSVR